MRLLFVSLAALFLLASVALAADGTMPQADVGNVAVGFGGGGLAFVIYRATTVLERVAQTGIHHRHTVELRLDRQSRRFLARVDIHEDLADADGANTDTDGEADGPRRVA